MSAYALPGLLFPPLPSCFDTYGRGSNNSSSSNISNHSHPSHHQHSNCHDRIHVDSNLMTNHSHSFFNATYPNGSGETTSYTKDSMSLPVSNTSCATMSNNVDGNNVPQISIVDAKIDAIRLIQSLVSSSSSSNNDDHRRQPLQPSVSNNPIHPPRTNDGYDECMIFTFQIVSYPSDHTTTATTTTKTSITRTLQQILQFHDNLLRVNHHCSIPNLRRRLHSDESDQNSMQNRSFSYLQDQIRCYSPVIEQWIRSVAVLSFVSSSPKQECATVSETLTVESRQSLLRMWNEFVSIHPVHDNDDLATITPTTTMSDQWLRPLPLHPQPQRRPPITVSTTGNHSRNHTKKKQRIIQPRRIVSMESIDEEDME